MLKKENELNCLSRAIKIGIKHHGITKRILKQLEGEEVARKDKERPDFIRIRKPESKHHRSTLIGVEHFQVDELSIVKQDGRIASTGVMYKKDIDEVRSKWHDITIKDKSIPDDLINDRNDMIAKQVDRRRKSNYYTFLNSFKQSLSKHLTNVAIYRENLSKLADNKYNIELAFLIEIHSEFSDLILVDKTEHQNEDGFMPMFDEIVNLLETIPKRDVNYIVLCIGNTIHNDNVKIIAVESGSVRVQLIKQNVIIYNYAGPEQKYFDIIRINQKTTPFLKKVDGQFESQFHNPPPVLSEEIKPLIKQAIQNAYEFRGRNINYATIRTVQHFVNKNYHIQK